MESNVLGKIHSSMSYNTYNTIQRVSFVSIYGLIAARIFLLNNFPITNNVASILVRILCAYSISTSVAGVENYTKDVREIKSIYDELITKYNKLNNTFGFNNPVEIYTVFNYIMYEGYLSKDKQFEFSSKEAREIKKIFGANIFNGQAVCRHIATMLCDIYNDRGIESNVLPVYSRTPVINIQTDNERPEQTIEQLYDFVRTYINDEKTRKVVNELIAKFGTQISLSHSYEDEGAKITKITGNHVITVATQDEKTYVLDPTQTRIYKMSQTESNVLVDNESDKIRICQGSLVLFNKSKEIKDIKSRLGLPSTSFEEDFATVERAKEICKNNLDIFEHFYNENSDMYDELSNKLIKIRKTNKLIKSIAR